MSSRVKANLTTSYTKTLYYKEFKEECALKYHSFHETLYDSFISYKHRLFGVDNICWGQCIDIILLFPNLYFGNHYTFERK